MSIPAQRSAGAFNHLHGHQDAPALCARLANNATRQHGTAGPAFLARLTAEDMEQQKLAIGQALRKFSGMCVPEGASAQVRHAAHYFALAAYAGELATRYGLTSWDPLSVTVAAGSLFEDWLAQRGGAGNEEDKQIIRQLRAHFEQHGEARYTDISCSVETDSHAPKTLMRCGFRETKTSRASGEEVSETTYYVLTEAWANEVIKGFNLRKANRLLIELGILIPDGRGKASRQKALPGMGKIRVYWVGTQLWELR